MAYSTGSSILAQDINTYLNTVRSVYATGSGDRGYGQSAVSQANVAIADTILASHWTGMISMINTCATHQGTAVTLPTIAAGSTIAVSTGLSNAVTAIDTNRLTSNATYMSTGGATTFTRSTAWTTQITISATATFSSVDAARYFFNGNGTVNLSFAQATPATPQDTAWSTIFAKVGTISIGANGSSRTGNSGTISTTVGYYQIGSTATTIYDGSNIGDAGAYSTNDVLVTAQVSGGAGSNGGNGNVLTITATLSDQHTNAFFDTISANATSVQFTATRPITILQGISAPTFASASGWTGS